MRVDYVRYHTRWARLECSTTRRVRVRIPTVTTTWRVVSFAWRRLSDDGVAGLFLPFFVAWRWCRQSAAVPQWLREFQSRTKVIRGMFRNSTIECFRRVLAPYLISGILPGELNWLYSSRVLTVYSSSLDISVIWRRTSQEIDDQSSRGRQYIGVGRSQVGRRKQPPSSTNIAVQKKYESVPPRFVHHRPTPARTYHSTQQQQTQKQTPVSPPKPSPVQYHGFFAHIFFS